MLVLPMQSMGLITFSSPSQMAQFVDRWWLRSLYIKIINISQLATDFWIMLSRGSDRMDARLRYDCLPATFLLTAEERYSKTPQLEFEI